ncbi:hypothetical protein LTR56_008330 [Elasticomyces elasticus]|nr:hypothetical protein LTR56_008330 [Elasticomyces elasticus]KAK3661466.1 hypothetical protein LTR22_007476 [Elasticomyces elasticus]KAK4926177.1 hypothetical protein LTR49_006881 [Elasticomyces elasticus]KAK5756887.1 hypothetical protein LTS12_012966 [Elasticomyces elasticus]
MGNAESLPIPSPQPASRLLSLPAELRIEIWEYHYSIPEGGVNLLEASTPTNGLILACRQTNRETSALYRDVRQRYWVETTFILHNTPPGSDGYRSKIQQHPVPVDFTFRNSTLIRNLYLRIRCRDVIHTPEMERYRKKLEQHYRPDAMLSLRRTDDRKEWMCVEIDRVPAELSQSRVYVSPRTRTDSPLSSELYFDDDGMATHWEARKKFLALSAEEIRAVSGVEMRLKEAVVPELRMVKIDANTPTIVPLPWPQGWQGPVAKRVPKEREAVWF